MSNMIVLSFDSTDFTKCVQNAVRTVLAELYTTADNKSDSETLLTRKQAAECIGVSTGTIDNFVRDGKLEKLKANSQTRFRKRDVLAVYQNPISAKSKNPRSITSASRANKL